MAIVIMLAKYWEYKHQHPNLELCGTVFNPQLPLKFSGYASGSRPIGRGNSESTVTVLPSTAVYFHGTYRIAQSVVPPNTRGQILLDSNKHTYISIEFS